MGLGAGNVVLRIDRTDVTGIRRASSLLVINTLIKKTTEECCSASGKLSKSQSCNALILVFSWSISRNKSAFQKERSFGFGATGHL